MKRNITTIVLAVCLVLSIGYNLNFRLSMLKEYKKEAMYKPKTSLDEVYHYTKLRIYRELVFPKLKIETDSLDKE